MYRPGWGLIIPSCYNHFHHFISFHFIPFLSSNYIPSSFDTLSTFPPSSGRVHGLKEFNPFLPRHTSYILCTISRTGSGLLQRIDCLETIVLCDARPHVLNDGNQMLSQKKGTENGIHQDSNTRSSILAGVSCTILIPTTRARRQDK